MVPVKHYIWVYIFILYICMALYVAGIGNVWDIGKFGSVIRMEEINFKLFQSDGMATYILNIIMFVPLGFLLPLIWKKYRKVWRVLCIGAVFSLAIEIGQLFNRRQTDIDDFLMNTIGACIGFGIWMLFAVVLKRRDAKTYSLTKNEAAVYIAASVLGTFFLYNPRYFISLIYR